MGLCCASFLGVHSGGTVPGSGAIWVQVQSHQPMQLTSKHGDMVVDFYPVKFATGEIHNRLMLKVVTFCGKTQSKSYIQIKDFSREVNSRIEGYGYKVTNGELIPQLFNSAMVCAC